MRAADPARIARAAIAKRPTRRHRNAAGISLYSIRGMENVHHILPLLRAFHVANASAIPMTRKASP